MSGMFGKWEPESFEVGRRVEVRDLFGDLQKGVVEGLDEKDGWPIVCYVTASGGSYWCYADQVQKVIS